MAKGDKSEKKQPLNKKEKKVMNEISRDCNINLHRRIHKVQFKRKAPKALSEIRSFAQHMMKTEDVRIDAEVNKYIWSQGIRNIPRRIRIRVQRKKNEDSEAGKNEFYTIVKRLDVESYKGLHTEVSKNQD